MSKMGNPAMLFLLLLTPTLSLQAGVVTSIPPLPSQTQPTVSVPNPQFFVEEGFERDILGLDHFHRSLQPSEEGCQSFICSLPNNRNCCGCGCCAVCNLCRRCQTLDIHYKKLKFMKCGGKTIFAQFQLRMFFVFGVFGVGVLFSGAVFNLLNTAPENKSQTPKTPKQKNI